MHYLFIETFAYTILLMLNISLTFSNITFVTKIFKHPIWKHLGNYGFYIYLCNISIRTYMLRKYVNLRLSYNQLLLIFLLITCLTALVLYVTIEVIYKKLILKRINKSKLLN